MALLGDQERSLNFPAIDPAPRASQICPMRAWSSLILLLGGQALAQVRINELQCTRTAGSDGSGVNGDWVELFNAGSAPVDLDGWALVIDGTAHILNGPLQLLEADFLVLWCDGRPELGPGHLAMDLPRTGGTLLLVAADRTTVADFFRWPALPPGCSMGRSMDGSREWGYFSRPSPGSPNATSIAVHGLLQPPGLHVDQGAVRISFPDADAQVHVTLDGTAPDRNAPLATAPIPVRAGLVVRAQAWADDALPSDVVACTPAVPADAWSLVIDPADLVGEQGIADVPSGNFSRSGKAWQRQAWLTTGPEGQALRGTGLAIAGSGTRSLPKRNFKLFAKDRFGAPGPLRLPDGSMAREVTLRADASPNAFLRNLFMKEVARRSGARVDLQPSFPVPLYINGSYQGLYRAMPTKNRSWARSLNQDRPVELVDGTGPKVLEGSGKSYFRLLKALANGTPIQDLEHLADLNSLVELACLDLWTGRGDHDLNVRCWRPDAPGGKWRWMLYDMDQWAPPEDLTVARMCATATADAPYVRELLRDPGLRARLLARLSALMATTLSPERATPLLDSIHAAHAPAMLEDHARWKDELPMPTPEQARTEILDHITGRQAPLLRQMAQATGLEPCAIHVEVQPPGAGLVQVEGLALTDDRASMATWSGIPVRFNAVPSADMEFAGWGDGTTDPERVIASGRPGKIIARFRPAAFSSQRALQQ